MDSDRFDRLTRFVASANTRRTLVGFAAALGLSPLLASAKNRRKKKKKCKKGCGPCARCKTGKCKRKADGTTCGPDLRHWSVPVHPGLRGQELWPGWLRRLMRHL